MSSILSEAELKKSYRRLAMKYHPDRNPNDDAAEIKFKEAKEAYEILADDQKRSAYDQFGHAGVDPASGTGAGGTAGFGDIFGDIFSDIFGDVFGGGDPFGRRQRSTRGSDLQYSMTINLEDAVRGVTEKIAVPALESCDVCSGTGAKKGSSPITCSGCNGAGQVRMQQGFFSVAQTCRQCSGSGQVIKDPCKPCKGKGRIERRKTLSVKIPAGVDQGDRIRLSAEGEAGVNGGPSGDLYVVINIPEHDVFSRDGNNLHCEMPISFSVAALGGEIQIPTLDGSAKIKVPAETQTGKVFRLRGKGIKGVRSSGYGDLMCHVVVETPVNLTERQKELLTDLEELNQSNSNLHSPKAKSWMDKVRSFFEG